MKSVYVTRELPPETMARLRSELQVEVNPHDRPLSRGELLDGVRGKDAVISLLSDRIDGEVLDAAGPQLRIVANFAVGYDNFDLEAATRRGVILTNTPGVLDDATATFAFTLLLGGARRLAEADRLLRSAPWTSGWAPNFLVGLDVDGKTLGIAGFGRIGRNLALKAKAFGMQVIYTDARRDEAFEREHGVRFAEKDELLREADFVSLHMPLLPDTRHWIGPRELELMKPTALLINTARGPVVDEAALVEALKARRIWGAALDVFEREPELAPGLAELDNATLAPHVASATLATRRAMGDIAVANVLKVLDGRPPDTCVNPEALRT
jgi:glyoxylate reductase